MPLFTLFLQSNKAVYDKRLPLAMQAYRHKNNLCLGKTGGKYCQQRACFMHS
jgi:hypothetical protein